MKQRMIKCESSCKSGSQRSSRKNFAPIWRILVLFLCFQSQWSAFTLRYNICCNCCSCDRGGIELLAGGWSWEWLLGGEEPLVCFVAGWETGDVNHVIVVGGEVRIKRVGVGVVVRGIHEGEREERRRKERVTIFFFPFFFFSCLPWFFCCNLKEKK